MEIIINLENGKYIKTNKLEAVFEIINIGLTTKNITIITEDSKDFDEVLELFRGYPEEAE